MAVDSEKVKDALDDFENDKFSDAKEKLSDVVKNARDEFLKKTLKLKGDKEEKKDDVKDDEKDVDADSDEKDDEKMKRKKRVSKAIKKKEKEE